MELEEVEEEPMAMVRAQEQLRREHKKTNGASSFFRYPTILSDLKEATNRSCPESRTKTKQ
jgi:hypothetical protein